jgi:hypothetical protein
MNCPQSSKTRALSNTTGCQLCNFTAALLVDETLNERTGTQFNFLEMPTDIVYQVVVFRLLFKLSLRDLVQIILIRGYKFS